jgi:hypothetical protein
MRTHTARAAFALALATLGACGSAEEAGAASAPLVTAQETTLLAPDGAAGDTFGRSVDLSDDGLRIIVGAPSDDTTAGGTDAGSVRIFRDAGSGSWTQETFLVGSQMRGFLGQAVAIDGTGSRVVMGAYQADLAGPINDAGTAFVFRRDASTWNFEGTLTPSAPASGDWFGIAVAISADGLRIIVGASQDDTAGGLDSGSARVFSRSGTTWAEEATLLPSSRAPNDGSGGAVALSADGSYALVGTNFGDVGGVSNAGYATIFVRSGTAWAEQGRITHPLPGANDFFGGAVSMSDAGDRVLIGAHLDDAPATDAGSAAVFVRTGAIWTIEGDLLTAPDAGASDLFGHTVALSADGARAAIGASQDGTTSAGALAGSARVFLRTASIWAEEAALYAPDAEASDFLGRSVSISADGARVIAGAPNDTTARGISGSVRVFSVAASPVGGACSVDAACGSGFCVDGVCCATRCAGGSMCQACSAARTGLADGTCAPLTLAAAASTVCRAARGACDADEACTAGVLACPSDVRAAGGTVCRAARPGEACDAAEVCSGASDACPLDGALAAGATCRSSAGACDLAETCDGTSFTCAPDARAVAGALCRDSVGACDLEERCDGINLACPVDAILPSGSVCRSSGGDCDVEEVCTGASPICPIDDYRAPSVTCRAAVSSCDRPEQCTGAGPSCPSDLFESPTLICRPASGSVCDAPDTCSGSSADCVERYLAGVVCRDATDACDASEVCTGASELCPPDLPTSAGITCRSSVDLTCDSTESCDGLATSCPADVNTCTTDTDGGVPDGGLLDGTVSADAGPPAAATGCSCRASSRRTTWVTLAIPVLVCVVARRRFTRRSGSRTLT